MFWRQLLDTDAYLIFTDTYPTFTEAYLTFTETYPTFTDIYPTLVWAKHSPTGYGQSGFRAKLRGRSTVLAVRMLRPYAAAMGIFRSAVIPAKAEI